MGWNRGRTGTGSEAKVAECSGCGKVKSKRQGSLVQF